MTRATVSTPPVFAVKNQKWQRREKFEAWGGGGSSATAGTSSDTVQVLNRPLSICTIPAVKLNRIAASAENGSVTMTMSMMADSHRRQNPPRRGSVETSSGGGGATASTVKILSAKMSRYDRQF